jgi:glycosyltransferase involved in cell wall biosynthesis
MVSLCVKNYSRMNNLTAVVLTKNEENYIQECINNLKWCEEILVLDSLSTDRTVEIVKQQGANVVLRPFCNFADQRNAAIDLVDTEWIFFVDADERIPEVLAKEIRLAIQNPGINGWCIPTKNYFFGSWVNYGGFYPDYHLRVARRKKIRFDPMTKVHENAILEGKFGYLQNALLHIASQTLGELNASKGMYASILAEMHYEKGLKPTYHLVVAPMLTFFEQCFVLKGYKDGKVGILLSFLWAYYAFIEYWKVWGIWWLNHKQKWT